MQVLFIASKSYELLLNTQDIFILIMKIVINQEIVSKELINYCGLDWEEQCLSFYNTIRQVRTASIEQVRNL